MYLLYNFLHSETEKTCEMAGFLSFFLWIATGERFPLAYKKEPPSKEDDSFEGDTNSEIRPSSLASVIDRFSFQFANPHNEDVHKIVSHMDNAG